MKNIKKQKISKTLVEKGYKGKTANFKISVAPMMDCTNLLNKALKNNNVYFYVGNMLAKSLEYL